MRNTASAATGEVVPFPGKMAARVGFGTAGLLRITSARRRQDALAAALASGITHFDTAPLYGFGESERALGRFLRGRRREELTLTTKFGLEASAFAARLAFFQGIARRALGRFPALRRAAVRNSAAFSRPPSFSRAAAAASLERSLRALRTDYVDFYLAHQASVTALPDEDLIAWLEDARRAGKIRRFGVATDFEWLPGVLQHRPLLAGVVQFDCDPTRPAVDSLAAPDRLVITYGFLRRGIDLCRARLQAMQGMGDDELGGLLLRGAALANPGGMVLMQSRSVSRIERNARAASSPHDDARVHELFEALRSAL